MWFWGLTWVVSVLLLLDAVPARACGAVARGRPQPGQDPYATLPYLAIEQTLIVWDRETRTEDFVREARFARTSEPFGFVVPVPGKPEVSKVASPFPALRKEYPYDPSLAERSRGAGAPAGAGGGKKATAELVEVLSVQRVGSFDVTVLRASEASALDGWLATNGFELTEPAKPWLGHYVELHFYFVAFRYAGAPPGTADGMTSETVRIRFETGAPYYPYLEPEIPRGAPIPHERMLAVWLVTQDPMLPIVTHTNGGKWTWQTPWRPTAATSALSANFLARVPAAEGTFPIRAKNVLVQPFLDVRTNRKNLGDVVFGYRSSHDLDRADVAALAPLLPALDGRIAPVDSEAGKAKRRGCALEAAAPRGGGDALPVAALVAGALVIMVARRRRGGAIPAAVCLAVASGSLVACSRRASISDPNERAVVEMLSGRPPYTLALATESRLVTTAKLDAPKIDHAGVEPSKAFTADLSSFHRCVVKSVPTSLDITIQTTALGKIEKLSTTPEVADPVRSNIEGCLRSGLIDTLVEPRQAVRIEIHGTFSQELVDPG